MTDELEKKKLLQFIDSSRDDLVLFLQELVAIPSDNPPGDCGEIAKHVHQLLQTFNFKQVSMFEIPVVELAKVGMTKVSNVVAYEVFDSEQGPEITLNSHGDVVPPGAGWTTGPYGGEIRDGKLYGRGSAVSKSDIVSFTFAVLALREVASSLKGKVSLAFTFDEETGGEMGPKWLLEKNLIKPDFAVCPGFSYSIVNAHNGCLHMEVTIKGKQAHAAEPQHGHDALESMTGVLVALYQYRKTLADIKSTVPGITSPTLVVGRISGGINTNVVPDECTIRLDRRLIPEENPEEVEKEIKWIITNAAAKIDGIEVETKRILLAKSFGPISENSPFVQSFKKNWQQIMEGELLIQGSPLYTDARHFYEAGIPVLLFGAGPRTLLEANGHRADEHVNIADLVNATKIVATSIFDLLSRSI